MKLTAILAGERIVRKAASAGGVVRRPAEHDGIQLDDEDGTFLNIYGLVAALERLRNRQEQRTTAKKRGRR